MTVSFVSPYWLDQQPSDLLECGNNEEGEQEESQMEGQQDNTFIPRLAGGGFPSPGVWIMQREILCSCNRRTSSAVAFGRTNGARA